MKLIFILRAYPKIQNLEFINRNPLVLSVFRSATKENVSKDDSMKKFSYSPFDTFLQGKNTQGERIFDIQHRKLETRNN